MRTNRPIPSGTPAPWPPFPRQRPRRALAALLAVATVATVFAIAPAEPAAAAGGNALSFADGSSSKTFGANGMVVIDGILAYDDQCQYDQGVKDFFYPATDVYLVPTGTAGGKLTDAGGGDPNTIVAPTSGVFLDEVIAFTSPGGNLGEGTYDIVYDTCQDGFLTDGDSVFPGAVVVTMPETLPSASPAIAQIKDRAREQYISWLQTHTILTALFSADKAKEILSCILLPDPGCALAVLAHLMDEGQLGARQAAKIQDLAAALVMNVAKNHGAIWKDPPDADFAQLPVLARPDDGDLPTAGQPLFDAVTGLTPELADEAALTEALLHAMERYQGAQAAGDGEWALTQARAARDLSEVLADQLTSSTAVGDLRTVVAAHADELDARTAEGADFANRVRHSGFSPEERRVLANLGLSTADVNDLEGQYVAQGAVVKHPASALVAALDGIEAGRSEMATALTASAASWDALVATLEGPDRTLPVADAGGPYAAPAGTPVTLDASASAPAPGHTLTALEWDLDADGAFDDATGATPTTTFATGGGRLVSVRVTDDAGHQAVAHAHVATTGGNQPPAIAGSTPPAATSLTVGHELVLDVDATDPEGATLTYAWQRDGQPLAGATPTLTWTPTAGDLGPHAVSVVVGDGSSAGTVRTWRVTVVAPDADHDGWTETTDCDDTRADVSPSMFERLGNQQDDDCDPGTPDAPPGGLTGTLWSWGESTALGAGLFTNRLAPAAVPALSDVVAIEASDRRGYAILSSGEVKAWGANFNGSLGDGTETTRRAPVSVVGVDGLGLLGNVRQIASEVMHTVAVRHDGTVLAWGYNGNGEVGDGSTTASRPAPVEVRRADGSALDGAVQVDAGESAGFALLDDGTVANWGTLRCDGTYATGGTPLKARTAQLMPLLGGGVVQIVAGKGLVLARKGDGSVWSCGGDPEELDRGRQNPTLKEIYSATQMASFGPGSGVIDVTAAPTAGFALKADGTVWGWGHNINGVLDPIAAASVRVWTPTQIPLPPGPPAVDIDADNACHVEVLRADGSVLSWGCNSFGAAGIGTNDTYTPDIHEVAIPGRTVTVAASGWNGYALVRPVDDPALEPAADWLRASAADATIGESTGGTVEVALSEPAPADVEVTWAIDGGPTGVATIATGSSSAAVAVAVPDDTLDEDDEELAFHIVAVSDGIEVERGVATVTVQDDDAAPALSIGSTSVTEGDTALTDATVAIDLSTASGKDVEVLWATVDGTATSPADHAAASGHVLIPAGETQAVVHLAVHGDDELEAPESFSVVLSDPVDATLATSTGTVTIVDDEPVRLGVTSPTVTEGDTGTTPATFAVTASAIPAGVTVTVPWAVAPGSATTPDDVAAGTGTVVLDHDTTTASVTIAVVGDTAVEGVEVFRLALAGATASDGRPVVPADPTVARILDDDVAEPEGPHFDFDGFYQPIDNLPTVNVVQAGQSIPVKFSLGGDQGLAIFEAGSPASKQVGCTSGDVADAIEETATPGTSGLSYDATTDTYHYVWKTLKAWKGQCRQLVVRFVDGTQAVAEFRFR